MMLSDRMGGDLVSAPTPRNPAADAIRKKIEDDLKR